MEQKMSKKEILRTVMAIGISIVILLLWFFVLEPMFFPKQEITNNEQDLSENNQNKNNDINNENTNVDRENESNSDNLTTIKNVNFTPLDIAQKNDYFEYETDKFIITFNKKGGEIIDIRYKEFTKEGENGVITYESGIYDESIKESTDFDGEDRPLRGAMVNFTTGSSIYKESDARFDYKIIREEKKVVLTTIYVNESENQIEVTKTFIFKEDENSNDLYNYDLEVSFRNLSDNNITVSNEDDVSFYIHWGGGVGPYAKQSSYDRWIPYIATRSGGNIEVLQSINDINKNDPDNRGVINSITPSWIGQGNRYFLIALIPNYSESNEVKIENVVYNTNEQKLKNQTDFFGIGYNGFILAKGEKRTAKITIYTGPKKHGTLADFGIKMEISAEHGGILEFLVRFAEWLLLSINSLIKNFGISIIIFTILLRAVLYPLQAKSLKSMARMKDLQPKMDEIKNRYKDKPELQQKHMMDLYKKEKINPMGGCLPMLLQFPFFIAFFNVMPYLVDLKGKAFLWIKDLSQPDTILKLPFFPDQLNILPILMAGVMVISSIMQQKSTPSSAQAGGGMNMKIFNYALPAVFLLITYYAPSGLTLYWTCSTLLGIAQQSIFNIIKNKNSNKEEKVVVLDKKGKPIKK